MNDFFSFIYFHTLDFERGTDDLIGINNGEKNWYIFCFCLFWGEVLFPFGCTVLLYPN